MAADRGGDEDAQFQERDRYGNEGAGDAGPSAMSAASGPRLSPPDAGWARGPRRVTRRKRVDEAVAEYRWRSDPEMARYDASRPVQVPFEDYRRNWSFDYRFTDMPGRSFAIEDV